jgi:two-component system response regulator YesN
MMRIEKSQQLLIRTTLRIYEIAEATGFASTVSFNYAFNRVVGMSPSQYREEHSLDT